mgnify:CR=1 FL=1|tara:strand:- start:455 stop:796 length:342 start_codon:yes stop_codon:yes gene_type:complete
MKLNIIELFEMRRCKYTNQLLSTYLPIYVDSPGALEDILFFALFILGNIGNSENGDDHGYEDDNDDIGDDVCRAMGIFSLLAEESRFPKASDSTFLKKIENQHKMHKQFSKVE